MKNIDNTKIFNFQENSLKNLSNNFNENFKAIEEMKNSFKFQNEMISSVLQARELSKTYEAVIEATGAFNKLRSEISPLVSSVLQARELSKTHEAVIEATGAFNKLRNEISPLVSSVLQANQLSKTYNSIIEATEIISAIKLRNEISSAVSSIIESSKFYKNDNTIYINPMKEITSFKDNITLLNSLDKTLYKVSSSKIKEDVENNNFYKNICGDETSYTNDDIQEFIDLSSTIDSNLKTIAIDTNSQLKDVKIETKQILTFLMIISLIALPNNEKLLKEIVYFFANDLNTCEKYIAIRTFKDCCDVISWIISNLKKMID